MELKSDPSRQRHPDSPLIREFNSGTDRGGIRKCLIELQDFERGFDPRMPPGEEIADAYIVDMQHRCDKHAGKILVADAGGDIAGYVTVLAMVSSGDLDDGNIEFGLIADLVVRERFRGRGLGRRLIAAAEAFARANDVRWLRMCVFAQNTIARSLYTSCGYSELYVDYEKDLDRE